jgi:hypothetical protein
MAESARHLVDDVFGARPVRQWVLSFPYRLRFLFASKPDAIGPVLAVVRRVSALNLNVHFHMLWLDGVDAPDRKSKPRLRRACAPSAADLTVLAGALVGTSVLAGTALAGWHEVRHPPSSGGNSGGGT